MMGLRWVVGGKRRDGRGGRSVGKGGGCVVGRGELGRFEEGKEVVMGLYCRRSGGERLDWSRPVAFLRDFFPFFGWKVRINSTCFECPVLNVSAQRVLKEKGLSWRTRSEHRVDLRLTGRNVLNSGDNDHERTSKARGKNWEETCSSVWKKAMSLI